MYGWIATSPAPLHLGDDLMPVLLALSVAKGTAPLAVRGLDATFPKSL